MSRRLPTILDQLFPDSDPEFAAIAEAWPKNVIFKMLSLVWEGFDALKSMRRFKDLDFSQDYAQVERSLTDLHQMEVTLLWRTRRSGFESFVPHHEPWEFESLTTRSGRPPSGDIGFVLVANRRLRWTVEGKFLKSPHDASRYLGDLQKYLDGKGAPLATEGALGGYLMTGTAEEFLQVLQKGMKEKLRTCADFPSRPHRVSQHVRDKTKLPSSTPSEFLCHHLPFVLN